MTEPQETPERLTTLIRIAEASAWMVLGSDPNGSGLPMAEGGFAFEHEADEEIQSIDYSIVPNVKSREIPLGPGKDAPRVNVGLGVMRVTFVSKPMSPEEAAQYGTTVDIDVKEMADRQKARDKIALPDGVKG